MLPVNSPYSVGDIPSDPELLLDPFPIVRAIRAMQMFVLKFSKEGWADLGNRFADGGATNQPVIVQGVGLSCGEVCQGYCQFESNF